MTIIATLGPPGSDTWKAARAYAPAAEIRHFTLLPHVAKAFENGTADIAVLPVYNTREGQEKMALALLENITGGHWIDNIILPIPLALGVPQHQRPDASGSITFVLGTESALRQCSEYISNTWPNAGVIVVPCNGEECRTIGRGLQGSWCLIDSEENLKQSGMRIIARDLAPYNRTRLAVIGRDLPAPSGYDATALITRPLRDRVGLLSEILNEFTRRGISLQDIRSDHDLVTQKLSFYIEAEGHVSDQEIRDALTTIEKNIIQEPHSVKVLGSFPRVDLQQKNIEAIGFVGTGDMSRWFADRLTNEGYKVILTGRSSSPSTEEMIGAVNVVVVCVPISATAATIKKYGPLLSPDQGLIILAGESEKIIEQAIASTREDVEVMLVHNLWGPQAQHMKDKNAIIVRTARSGKLCSEFEGFMYKHGARIVEDSAKTHDLLMGVCQKLPTAISLALAATLEAHGIDIKDVASHATLTSLYHVLAMARIHAQNPGTYAEILAAAGEGRQIVSSFAAQLQKIITAADNQRIEQIEDRIDRNAAFLGTDFLTKAMRQAKRVDRTLGDNH